MSKLQLPNEIEEKLERAAHPRWVDPRDDRHKLNEIADERAAVTAELTKLFGPVIRQLVEAEVLYVYSGENDRSRDAYAPIAGVGVDDEFGITLDCEPNSVVATSWLRSKLL